MTENSPSAPNQKVIAALRLGWNMAQLYGQDPDWSECRPATKKNLKPHLASASEISDKEKAQILLDRVAADLSTLNVAVSLSSLDSYKEGGREKYRSALNDIFIDIHSKLAAADSKLDTALSLGHILSDTIYLPEKDERANLEHCFTAGRLQNAHEWLNALSPDLPTGSADAVSGSLKIWESRVAATEKVPDERFIRMLHAQGKLWHQLLCGDKSVASQIHPEHYAEAAGRLTERFAHTLGHYLKTWWLLVIILLAITGALLVWLILSSHLSAGQQLLGYIATALSIVGISWKTFGTSLGRAFSASEKPLWEAELREAAVQACTLHIVKKSIIRKQDDHVDYRI